MINLKEIFKKLEHETYSIIKLSNDFPNYKTGSDIDIFCLNTENIAKKILAFSNRYLNKGYEIQINENENKIYIDFLNENKIDFRFDLYKKIPSYIYLNIKPALFESIIENSCQKKIDNDFYVYIPNIVDELIIRYIEYQEWYGRRPDKIKHIEYINNFICDEILKKTFLNKLHHYTALPRNYEEFDRQWAKNELHGIY